MELFSVRSGSSGNCVCVGTDQSHVMIDAGISAKQIEAGLNSFDMTSSDMDVILLTHEHSDHISGLGVLARKYHLPIYATQGTIDAVATKRSLGTIDPSLYHVIRPDQTFTIGDMEICPMHISHDAADPVAYTMRQRTGDGDKRVAVCTDLGVYDDYTIERLKGMDAMLLEANHDVKMLEVGPYPYPLKQRILGSRGHLSNESSGQLLGRLLHDKIKHILLGHLSHENNLEELAYETVRLEVTLGDNPYQGSDFPITVAHRDRPSVRVIV